MDSNLTFKSHVKRVANKVKFNLQNFKQIRPFLSLSAARMYLHKMIFSHIEYCFTNWSLTNMTTLKPIEVLKRAIKILDKKALEKHKLLSFENVNFF